MQKLRELRKAKGLTTTELGKIIGCSNPTITNYELGNRKPDPDTLKKLADYFEVSVDYLLGRKEKSPVLKDEVELNDLYPIPLLGEVVAGVPIEAQENLEGYIYISYRPSEEYFALRVHGDSMKNAGIFNGSVVVCHKQSDAENGEVVVAMLNGEQTVKRFKQIGDSIFLMPENPDFEPIVVAPKDELLILGKVVEVRVTF